MFLTSIILTAAALYLLTYGGRTSIEETVVARDAMTEHYVTPYYKIESVSDDRGVPKPEAPDSEHAPVLSLSDAYETTFTSQPEWKQNEVAWGVISQVTGHQGTPLADQVQHLNDWVQEAEGRSDEQDRAWQAYQWAHKFNADDHVQKVDIDFGH